MSDTPLKHNSDSNQTSVPHIDNEALRRRFNPDGSPLRNHQLRLLEMLKFLDGVCRKHGIKYWLSSGNCIGAVRHGGFVPWDDDIDVEMMRDDYLKFVEVFKETDEYVLQTYQNDPYYMMPFAKMRDKNSEIYEEINGHDISANFRYKGIFIDIFYIEPAPWLPVRVLDSLNYYMVVWSSKLNGSRPNRLFHMTRKMMFGTFSLMRRLFSKHSRRLFPTYGAGFHNPRKIEDNLSDTILMAYEDGMYPVPRNYDSYLRGIYGEYMSLPDLDSLHVHLPSLALK
ncbi:MAG: LicD family protein [Bacteroidales bacterium]|nr:LicD family protein [Bacteroidales bacterium]